MDVLFAIILWVFFCNVAAIIAYKNGRSWFLFLMLSIILSPIIGVIAALVAGKNTNAIENQKIATGQNKKCPYCAELIKSEAKVCRYCSKELPISENPQSTNTEKTNNSSLAIENYVSIDEFVTQKNINKEKVIKMIREGFYNGQIVEGEWYVHKSEIS